jgi:hypothetical protein
MPTETYRSEEAYRKSRAYTHIHGIPTHAEKVCIKGRGCRKVEHGKLKKRKLGAARTQKRTQRKSVAGKRA